MKTIAIGAARAQYTLDPAKWATPTIVEVDGKPVTALVPDEQRKELQEQQPSRKARILPVIDLDGSSVMLEIRANQAE